MVRKPWSATHGWWYGECVPHRYNSSDMTRWQLGTSGSGSELEQLRPRHGCGWHSCNQGEITVKISSECSTTIAASTRTRDGLRLEHVHKARQCNAAQSSKA